MFNFCDCHGQIKYCNHAKGYEWVVSLRDLLGCDERCYVGPRLVDDYKQLIKHIRLAFSAGKNE